MITRCPLNESECKAMHGDVEILRPFNEILVTTPDGKIRAFSGQEMKQAGKFIQTCKMPVVIEQAEYQAGTGMEYRYTSNKRANSWRIMPPKSVSYVLKALPRDGLEKRIAFDSMFRAGISQTLAGCIVGVSGTCMIHWAKEHKKHAKALLATADGVTGAA